MRKNTEDMVIRYKRTCKKCNVEFEALTHRKGQCMKCEAQTIICDHCGLYITFLKYTNKRRFCSKSCGKKYRVAERHKAMNIQFDKNSGLPKIYKVNCNGCNIEFMATGSMCKHCDVCIDRIDKVTKSDAYMKSQKQCRICGDDFISTSLKVGRCKVCTDAGYLHVVQCSGCNVDFKTHSSGTRECKPCRDAPNPNRKSNECKTCKDIFYVNTSPHSSYCTTVCFDKRDRTPQKRVATNSNCVDCNAVFSKLTNKAIRCVPCRDVYGKARKADWKAERVVTEEMKQKTKNRQRARKEAIKNGTFESIRQSKAAEKLTKTCHICSVDFMGYQTAKYCGDACKNVASKAAAKVLQDNRTPAENERRRLQAAKTNKLLEKTDPEFLIKKRLRSRVSCSMINYKAGSKKAGSAVSDVGCTMGFLMKHLESGYYDNPKTGEPMSLDNYGFYGWHIDHIKPLSRFDLTDREQFLKACNYLNLQPLWATDNLTKNAKYNGEHDKILDKVCIITIDNKPRETK